MLPTNAITDVHRQEGRHKYSGQLFTYISIAVLVLQPSLTRTTTAGGTPLGARPAGSWQLRCWRLAEGDWTAVRRLLSSQLEGAR